MRAKKTGAPTTAKECRKEAAAPCRSSKSSQQEHPNASHSQSVRMRAISQGSRVVLAGWLAEPSVTTPFLGCPPQSGTSATYDICVLSQGENVVSTKTATADCDVHVVLSPPSGRRQVSQCSPGSDPLRKSGLIPSDPANQHFLRARGSVIVSGHSSAWLVESCCVKIQ